MKFCLYIALLVCAVFARQVHAQDEPTQAELDFAASWLDGTSSASPGERVLIAAMLAQQHQPERTPDFLSIALSDPDYTGLRYNLVAYFCLFGAVDPLCDTAFDTELVALDRDNLEPYLYSMLRQLDSGNPEGALLALTQGNSAPHINNYYFDKVALLRSGLARAGYPQQQINGAAERLAGAGTMYALYAKVLAICAERSSVNSEWKAQCLQLGRRFEHEAKTAMQNVFGFAIQRDSLGNSAGDEQERAAVLARRDDFNAIRDKAGQQLDWWNDVALKTDALYRDMVELGEMPAVLQALGEP